MQYFKIISGLICLTVAFSMALAEDKTTNLSSVETAELVIRKCIVQATENSCLAIPGLTLFTAKKMTSEHLSEAIKTHRPVEIAQVSGINSLFPPNNETVTKWTISFDNGVFSVKNDVHTETNWSAILFDIFCVITTIFISTTSKISFSLKDRYMSKSVIQMTIFFFSLYYYIYGLISGFSNWFTAVLPGILFVGSIIWAMYDNFTSKLSIILAGGLLSWYVSTISGIGEFVNMIDEQPKITDFGVLHWLSLCILVITLDYTIVYYRRYKEKSNALSSTFN